MAPHERRPSAEGPGPQDGPHFWHRGKSRPPVLLTVWLLTRVPAAPSSSVTICWRGSQTQGGCCAVGPLPEPQLGDRPVSAGLVALPLPAFSPQPFSLWRGHYVGIGHQPSRALLPSPEVGPVPLVTGPQPGVPLAAPGGPGARCGSAGSCRGVGGQGQEMARSRGGAQGLLRVAQCHTWKLKKMNPFSVCLFFFLPSPSPPLAYSLPSSFFLFNEVKTELDPLHEPDGPAGRGAGLELGDRGGGGRGAGEERKAMRGPRGPWTLGLSRLGQNPVEDAGGRGPAVRDPLCPWSSCSPSCKSCVGNNRLYLFSCCAGFDRPVFSVFPFCALQLRSFM